MKKLTITQNKTGARRFTKVSYPIRYGRYGEIRTPDWIYQFNLSHEIKFIQGHGNGWPPSEWLKRTVGNDWVYYLAGDYSGVRDAFGEYYLPCPDYSTNSFITRNPFNDKAVISALSNWQAWTEKFSTLARRQTPVDHQRFVRKIGENNPTELDLKAGRFHEIIGGRVSVLPPDTRHVDYEVIPVVIADGCLYNCGFCRVKSNRRFTPRTPKNIIDQIKALKAFYGADLSNYNAIFLGQHDALAADPKLILFAAKKAYELLELKKAYMDDSLLFLFGSVDALMDANPAFFDALQALPFYTYINIGFESADSGTLKYLKKPITAPLIEQAFKKMLAINKKYNRVEITANFVYGDHLPAGHLPAFFELIEKEMTHSIPKGTIYFSPLFNNGAGFHENIVRNFYRIKTRTPLPCYLYLIQRL